MEPSRQIFLEQHRELSRRYFLRFGAVGIAAMRASPLLAEIDSSSPIYREAVAAIESWLTPQDDFQDVSRGRPKPHTLDASRRAEVGLTRDTWKLEVVADPEHPAELRHPLSESLGTAFDFAALMRMAETRRVRFTKLMTCLNIGCPLGNGIWEGVPMRDVLWKTQPQKDLRRVIYFGYHNDDPAQRFRSSLPVGRVLEDPFGMPPVILCYKLNGEFLTPERGGPVRVVVPEAYGFKSIKWLTHLYLSNNHAANDTYAEQNNDVDSPLKTFCETLSVPRSIKANEPFAVTGYAQVGISGLQRVEVSIQNKSVTRDQEQRDDDAENEDSANALDWTAATILPPPKQWGGSLPDNRIPEGTIGFDSSGEPKSWPIRLSKAHWAILLPGLPAGTYVFRSRTVDQNGAVQPMPRPFRKSGRAHVEQVSLEVTS